MHEERIIELEIKAAYQEDLLQTLNRIVSQQQQQIDRLEVACRLLNERIQSLSDQAGHVDPGQQIPPHY
ncbi:MAG: SlyX family protein [Gammaproteobacteria bacterium]